VLTNQVHRHVPLTTIAYRIGEKEVDGAVVDRTVGSFDDCLEQVVSSLELVPEVDVGLAELEILEIHLLHRPDPEQVQSGEKPAPTTPHLSRHLPVVQLGAERVVDVLDEIPIQRQVRQLDIGNRVLSYFVR